MFKAEWEYLFKHKLMLIVIIVIGFIPSIYAVTFLKSMWDPYGKLQDLPVAVVNQDQAVTYQGQHLDVGHQLATNLKRSNGMDFKLVSSETAAKNGLKRGDYYMVVTIPKSFSHNATTLMQKKPQKMVLHYETSAGHNFTASKMTASAADSAAASVSEQITKTYAKTLFGSLKQLGTGMATAGKNNQKLAKGSRQAEQANQKITTGLNTLAKSTLTLANGAKSLNQGLNQYINGIDQVSSGSQQVTTGLDSLLSNSQQLASGVRTLRNGSQQLSSGVQNYTAGAQTLNSSTQQYVNGVASANQGAQGIQAGLATLNQKTSTIQSGTQRLTTASADLTTGLQALSSSSGELATNLAAMQRGVAATSNQQSTLTTQLEQLAATLSRAGSDTGQLTGVKAASNQLQTALASLQADQEKQQATLQAKVAAAADAQKLTAEQKAAMVAAVSGGSSPATDAVKTAAAQLNTALSNVGQSNVNTTAATQQLAALKQTLTTVAAGQQSLQSGLTGLAGGAATLTAKLQQAAGGMNTLNQGLATLQQSTPALTAGVAQLSDGATSLASGTAALTSKGQQLAAGTQSLASSGNQLNRGAASLNSGLSTLNGQVPSLMAGVGQLADGSKQVTSGLQTLGSKGTQLTSGAGQLASGATQLNAGSQQLANGSQQLGTGLEKVQAGNQTLGTKLTQAGTKAKVDPTKLTYAQVAKPATTSHTERDRAKNNGTGMAPYMMSVSLFVGALAFNMMFDTYTPRKYPRTGIGWWLSKASVLDGFALFESILIVTFLMLIDGLAPVHVWATFGMVLCIALAFMSIVYWLNLVLGKVGSFFSMILLVLQLGGSGGTYPIELSNGFFQAIHPWLPMTYAVNGLRETLMIGNTALSEMGLLFLIALGFSALSILFFARRRGRLRRIDFAAPTPATADGAPSTPAEPSSAATDDDE
ncbi:YhgE/Pip domain-containing protein [Lactiplantibacillus garii]|uniref:YhgE/Pip domain-containing protein n=1 Tax=Lactiplantibacillus garii TaxID=2306423 RepID=A0A426D9Y8_9LACO|nr:YhgE/Pip domain-containing protein [Lactiplantibacillus garii]RRK11420.1 YhgE/Pip domain-containing protein [Lactiplantibacillus garii]